MPSLLTKEKNKMTYLANKNFSYAINHVIHFFEKDKEVVAPADEISYMLEQKFIREAKPVNQTGTNAKTKEQLVSAIEAIKEKMSKEMSATKLQALDKKKAEFEAELAKLED